MDRNFVFDDWVVYDNGYKSEIGRIASLNEKKNLAFVCYRQGCTASATNLDDLRLAKDSEIEKADVMIGYHRFDEYCKKRIEEACYMCKAKLP